MDWFNRKEKKKLLAWEGGRECRLSDQEETASKRDSNSQPAPFPAL